MGKKRLRGQRGFLLLLSLWLAWRLWGSSPGLAAAEALPPLTLDTLRDRVEHPQEPGEVIDLRGFTIDLRDEAFRSTFFRTIQTQFTREHPTLTH
jgi:hypothetical protein